MFKPGRPASQIILLLSKYRARNQLPSDQLKITVNHAFGIRVNRGRPLKSKSEILSSGFWTIFTVFEELRKASYQRRFVCGESMDKDKIRIDQKMPTLEYSLIYRSGQLSGIINGSSFTPRQDASDTFLAQHRHSIDNLLRYKEDGSTLSLVGRDKQKGLDLYVLDVIDKDKQSTRYYLSTKTLRVLWLEYEEPAPGGSTPLKYSRKFLDYRYAQGTLVPYRSVLFEEGKQIQETRILNVTYGVKLDDALFKSPEA